MAVFTERELRLRELRDRVGDQVTWGLTNDLYFVEGGFGREDLEKVMLTDANTRAVVEVFNVAMDERSTSQTRSLGIYTKLSGEPRTDGAISAQRESSDGNAVIEWERSYNSHGHVTEQELFSVPHLITGYTLISNLQEHLTFTLPMRGGRLDIIGIYHKGIKERQMMGDLARKILGPAPTNPAKPQGR